MPFEPMNGPATFIQMIHNINSVWKESAKVVGIDIKNNINTISLLMIS